MRSVPASHALALRIPQLMAHADQLVERAQRTVDHHLRIVAMELFTKPRVPALQVAFGMDGECQQQAGSKECLSDFLVSIHEPISFLAANLQIIFIVQTARSLQTFLYLCSRNVST